MQDCLHEIVLSQQCAGALIINLLGNRIASAVLTNGILHTGGLWCHSEGLVPGASCLGSDPASATDQRCDPGGFTSFLSSLYRR